MAICKETKLYCLTQTYDLQLIEAE